VTHPDILVLFPLMQVQLGDIIAENIICMARGRVHIFILN